MCGGPNILSHNRRVFRSVAQSHPLPPTIQWPLPDPAPFPPPRLLLPSVRCPHLLALLDGPRPSAPPPPSTSPSPSDLRSDSRSLCAFSAPPNFPYLIPPSRGTAFFAPQFSHAALFPPPGCAYPPPVSGPQVTAVFCHPLKQFPPGRGRQEKGIPSMGNIQYARPSASPSLPIRPPTHSERPGVHPLSPTPAPSAGAVARRVAPRSRDTHMGTREDAERYQAALRRPHRSRVPKGGGVCGSELRPPDPGRRFFYRNMFESYFHPLLDPFSYHDVGESWEECSGMIAVPTARFGRALLQRNQRVVSCSKVEPTRVNHTHRLTRWFGPSFGGQLEASGEKQGPITS